MNGDGFTPKQAGEWLDLSPRRMRTYLQRLMNKGYLEAASGTHRVRTYRLAYRDPLELGKFE